MAKGYHTVLHVERQFASKSSRTSSHWFTFYQRQRKNTNRRMVVKRTCKRRMFWHATMITLHKSRANAAMINGLKTTRAIVCFKLERRLIRTMLDYSLILSTRSLCLKKICARTMEFYGWLKSRIDAGSIAFVQLRVENNWKIHRNKNEQTWYDFHFCRDRQAHLWR